jgi:hypothetical protein
VFVYGVCAGPSGRFEQVAKPAILKIDPQARILVRHSQSSIHAAYNSILMEAESLDGIEGLVLLHDDTVIEDPDIEGKLREVFADPAVGIIGVVGGGPHPRMQWWEGERHGYVRDNQQGILDFGGGVHDVHTVDGLFIALSRSALRLRFDEDRYHGFHGYDAEICAQARAAGLRVVVAQVDVYHDNKANAWYSDKLSYDINNIEYQLKWKSPDAFRRAALHVLRLGLPVVRNLRNRGRALLR